MTLSQKVTLSLLISVIFFAGFTVLAYTGLFDLVEAKFYNPSITSSLTKQIEEDALLVDNFLAAQENVFLSTLKEAPVRRSFLPNQSEEDIFERSRINGVLRENVSGLQWIRFIDAGGVRLHYSSLVQDILRQDESSTAYKNFPDAEPAISYENIASSDQGEPKLIFDERGNRFLYSFPFYDSFDVFRGTALFSVSVRSLEESMIREGRVKIGENITVIASPSGLVLGIPAFAENDLNRSISSIWNEGKLNLSLMDSSGSGASFVLVSGKTTGGIFLGRMVDEELFEFPSVMKIILLLSFFFTIYLTVFLICNIRQDSVTVVQNRLKKLQISLIEQYYERKSDMDWGQWSRELEQRRDEIRAELKHGLKAGTQKKDKDGKNDIDILIDKSWDELLGVIGSRRETGISEEKLKAVINKIIAAPEIKALQAGSMMNKEAAPYVTPESIAPQSAAENPAAVSSSEAAAEAEPVEELTELVEEVEPVEELAELVEDAAPIEELAETVEETELVEEIAAVEEVEPVEELTELVEEAEPVEELTEFVEEASPVEELAEFVEEVEPVEELAEAADEIELVEEFAAVDNVRPVEEFVEVVEEALPLEELEELESIDEVENVVAEEAVSAGGNVSDVISGHEFEKMASQIEFSSSPETEDGDGIDGDLEVVSPFSSMPFDFNNEGEDGNGYSSEDGQKKNEKPAITKEG